MFRKVEVYPSMEDGVGVGVTVVVVVVVVVTVVVLVAVFVVVVVCTGGGLGLRALDGVREEFEDLADNLLYSKR